jgi:hypothetical protein
MKAITVTAANAAGVVTGVNSTVIGIPPAGLIISGPVTGVTGTAYRFVGTVVPEATTRPLTYTWQASGGGPITHASVLSVTDAISFTWNVTGLQQVSVWASNAWGTLAASSTITITPLAEVFVPVVIAPP